MATSTAAPPTGGSEIAPQADHGEGSKSWLARIAEGRAWLFLVVLILAFELWSRLGFGGTFVGSAYNWQSIAVTTVAPLLLAVGETFVIISGGIDLSVGFTMGLGAVVAAHVTDIVGQSAPEPVAVLCGVVAAVLVAGIPGLINGLLVSRLRIPPFIGTLGMYGVARGAAYLLAGGTTVPVSDAFFAGSATALSTAYRTSSSSPSVSWCSCIIS